jgi:integrase
VGCVADSTGQRTEQIIRLHLSPAIGHIDLQKLSPQHIQTMIAGFKKKRAPGTVRLYYGVLHNALDRAVKLGLLPRNPTDAVEPPPAGESPGKSMSREHEAAVLAFLEREGHRLTELVRIAIKTGMRQGELLDLHWSDINFDKGELRIRKGKTKSSRRTLSLSGEIIASLRRQWEFQKLERMGNRDKWKEHGLVFPTSSGRPMAGSHLDISWHTIQKNAGIPDSEHYRWHDLRHTATTRFAEAGVPPGVAMKILGHSTITTTMNIYSHVGDESQRNAFEKIADLGA